jgi:nucleotide-binding universal stress UspA family protein
MKIVIGTGNGTESSSPLDLVGRLQFKDANVDLVYVVERIASPLLAEGSLAKDPIERFLQLQEKEGHERLSWAHDRLREYGVEANTNLRAGFIANEILLAAYERQADLIAIGSRDEGALQKLVIGSVGRKLVNKAHTNLLVARGPLRSQSPIDAVFATDHSDYANRCLDCFVALAPKGIRRITVLTVYPKALIDGIRAVADNFKAPLDQWITQQLEHENTKVIRKLSPLGYELESRVLAGAVDEAIDATMKASSSQLLVLGAQGHGFVERLAIGSVSFQQVVAGQHSVLVLRV